MPMKPTVEQNPSIASYIRLPKKVHVFSNQMASWNHHVQLNRRLLYSSFLVITCFILGIGIYCTKRNYIRDSRYTDLVYHEPKADSTYRNRAPFNSDPRVCGNHPLIFLLGSSTD